MKQQIEKEKYSSLRYEIIQYEEFYGTVHGTVLVVSKQGATRVTQHFIFNFKFEFFRKLNGDFGEIRKK